jgi:Cft2 family RNA processing exonuclease
MAQRTRRRHADPRKAPDWVPDLVLDRLGRALGAADFRVEARRPGGLWAERLDTLLGLAGGSVPPAELLEPLDEVAGRYGITRVALTMLRVGMPMSVARQAVLALADEQLDGVTEPVAEEEEAAAEEEAPVTQAAEPTDRVVRERDRLAEELRRERERVREKDRKLREERAAHAATRSELTSERDKARHAAAEAQRQLESGPSGVVVEELRTSRDAAEAAARDAAGSVDALRAELASARALTRRAEQSADKARSDADAQRRATAEQAAKPPSAGDLLRAARHLGTAALLRLDAPLPGDAELLEAIAAITRWHAAVGGAPRRSSRVTAEPAPPPPEPSPPPRSRAARARAAAQAVGGPIRVVVAGGGGVGASAYLVEYGGHRLLLDCGIGGGGRGAALPAMIDAVVLSHAHGDHMGGLPDLLRRNPDLRVYCSKQTKQLATWQANAADDYIPGDRLLVRDPDETYRILDGAVELTLHRVAHILGSCAVRLRFADDRVLVYSGDLGGSGLRTLQPASPLPVADASVVVLESTLGDRGPIRASHEQGLVREVASVVSSGGCAVFPAANIGRAQELAALLGECFANGTLPVAPVLMSPLARRVLDRYRLGDRDGWLADCPYPPVETLGADRDPGVVAANAGYVIIGGASGQERRAGQLVFAAAQNPRCGVFFTGYSGPAARQKGRGDRFEVVGDDGASLSTIIQSRWVWVPSPDHASQRELVAAVAQADRDVPIVLVHGVDEAKHTLAEKLAAAGHRFVRCGQDGDVIDVGVVDG